jgi:hypothetical protein
MARPLPFLFRNIIAFNHSVIFSNEDLTGKYLPLYALMQASEGCLCPVFARFLHWTVSMAGFSLPLITQQPFVPAVSIAALTQQSGRMEHYDRQLEPCRWSSETLRGVIDTNWNGESPDRRSTG